MYHDRVCSHTRPESTEMMQNTRLTAPIAQGSASQTHAEQLTIEPARFSDLRAVAALQRRSFPPRLAYRYPTLFLLRVLPSVQFEVAREGEKILGCAIGDRHGGQSRVVNICVDPAARRRGIGTRLLRQLESRLPDGDVVLMAEIENDGARSLYRNEGYQEIGISRGYYGRGRDGVWMQKLRSREARDRSG